MSGQSQSKAASRDLQSASHERTAQTSRRTRRKPVRGHAAAFAKHPASETRKALAATSRALYRCGVQRRGPTAVGGRSAPAEPCVGRAHGRTGGGREPRCGRTSHAGSHRAPMSARASSRTSRADGRAGRTERAVGGGPSEPELPVPSGTGGPARSALHERTRFGQAGDTEPRCAPTRFWRTSRRSRPSANTTAARG